MTLEELELSARSYNCLKNANISTLRELVVKTEAELLTTKNFGRKSLKEIKEVLADFGLRLGMRDDDDPNRSVTVSRPSKPLQPTSSVHRLRQKDR